MMRKKNIVTLLMIGLISLIFPLTFAGCSNNPQDSTKSYQMASLDDAPREVREAPQVVQEAYQFAIANPEILENLPCYCGCGPIGHKSNYACYVQNVDENGAITYDTHALGCSICVDITQDAMRLLKEGKTLPEIRIYIDETYAQYGPSNMPADE